MKTTTIKTAALIATVISFATVSCKKEKPEQEHNDNEMITTVELQFTEQGTSTPFTFKWQDLDGDGGNAPIIDEIKLAPNKVYNVSLKLWDNTKTPAENITEEVAEEGADHRFYYTPSGPNIAVSNLNNDSNGVPLGITSTWTTTGAAEGTIGVVLRHYSQGGKEAGDPVNSSKSSTDVDVSFNTVVE